MFDTMNFFASSNKRECVLVCTLPIFLAVAQVLKATKHLAEKLAQILVVILMRGESGTGKELFAHAIHRASDRCNEPLLWSIAPLFRIHCWKTRGAFKLLGRRLLRREKRSKAGLISIANRGTLFLDEIGDLGVELQAKLLQVLQKKRSATVG